MKQFNNNDIGVRRTKKKAKVQEVDLPCGFLVVLRKIICQFAVENPYEEVFNAACADNLENAKWLRFMYNDRVPITELFCVNSTCCELSYCSPETFEWITEIFADSFKPEYQRVMDLWHYSSPDNLPRNMELVMNRAIRQTMGDASVAVLKTIIKFGCVELFDKYYDDFNTKAWAMSVLDTHAYSIHSSKLLKYITLEYPDSAWGPDACRIFNHLCCHDDGKGEKIRECLNDLGEWIVELMNYKRIHPIESLIKYIGSGIDFASSVKFEIIELLCKLFPVPTNKIPDIGRQLEQSMRYGKRWALLHNYTFI